jgi:sorting nexin-1/2
MADEPPPIDDFSTEELPTEKEDTKELDDTENIFGEPLREPKQPPVAQPPPKEDLFEDADDTSPVPPLAPVVETERPHTDSEPPTLEPDVVETKPVAPPVVTPPTTSIQQDDDLFGSTDEDDVPKPKPVEQMQPAVVEEEEEDDDEDEEDKYEMTITVAQPEKVGDGMNAYMTYLVTTKTSLPSFKESEVYVRRRFSDFLGLYYRLAEKYMCLGRIVPPAPEKSLTGMTKVKFSKSEESQAFFIERRRANLERFLNRLASHPVLKKEEDFRNFLENPGELPKAKETAAMSGAGFMRLVKNVGMSISKISGKKTDIDSWFDDRLREYDVLETHLKKLHSSIDGMLSARKELCGCTNSFVKSLGVLANVEENSSVSRALTRLSEVQEKVESLHMEQSNRDLYIFGETIRDYVALIDSIKESFNERVKVHNGWMASQKTLQNKRDTETKLQTSGKTEKLPQVQAEIEEWEKRVKEGEKSFNKCSKVLKREIERFEVSYSVIIKSSPDKFIRKCVVIKPLSVV